MRRQAVAHGGGDLLPDELAEPGVLGGRSWRREPGTATSGRRCRRAAAGDGLLDVGPFDLSLSRDDLGALGALLGAEPDLFAGALAKLGDVALHRFDPLHVQVVDPQATLGIGLGPQHPGRLVERVDALLVSEDRLARVRGGPDGLLWRHAAQADEFRAAAQAVLERLQLRRGGDGARVGCRDAAGGGHLLVAETHDVGVGLGQSTLRERLLPHLVGELGRAAVVRAICSISVCVAATRGVPVEPSPRCV